MKDELLYSRSSVLVSTPAIVICLILGVLAAFWGQKRLAGVLLLFFLGALLSRLWGFTAGRGVRVSASAAASGLFPGEELEVEITVQNNKFLPVLWMELFFPLSEQLCLIPENSRQPEDWEFNDLAEMHASDKLVGEQRLSFLLWYENVRLTTRWQAKCRGLYSTQNWLMRTGDGFGLSQIQRPFFQPVHSQTLAVYPKLTKVSPELFLRNLWNAETGAKGVMEDITVIRSTREYMASDSAKYINWRLAARGLPLSVNVYEDILPQSVHFIFDGESFFGPDPHPEEMEEALSILASEVVVLARRQVQCGISLCQGTHGHASNHFAAQAPQLLYAMAGYQPMEPKLDEDSRKPVAQKPIFDEPPIYSAAHQISRFYYVCHDTSQLAQRSMLLRLGHTRVTLLTYCEAEHFGEFECVSLARLKEADEHE